MSIVDAVQELVPPIAWKGLRQIRDVVAPVKPKLFDGDSAMFERLVRQCRVYGEYGVGASTNWVYANTDKPIIANETSPVWAEQVLAGKDRSRIDLELVDLGPLGKWGWPKSYARRAHFETYCSSIWRRGAKPDLVLVDGRFRVCCFLTSVLEGGPGLRLLFDDYTNRPRYHVVEELVPVRERCGRQAFFEVDNNVDMARVEELRAKFAYVMD